MSLYLNPRQFQNDEKGRSAPYATLDFYDTATFDRKDTYSDIGLTSPLPNPVVADAAGRFPKIYLAVDSGYRVVYSERQYPREDAPLTEVWTEDDVWASLGADIIGTDPDEIPTNADLYVDSISDLPAATGSGQVIAVTSYYPGWAVVGDGLPKGGGRVVDSSETSVHDGILRFDPDQVADIGTPAYYTPAAATACWERVGVDDLTLFMAGAVAGDRASETLNTTAINKALTVSASASIGIGRFYHDSTIAINSKNKLSGMGMKNSILHHTGTGNAIEAVGAGIDLPEGITNQTLISTAKLSDFSSDSDGVDQHGIVFNIAKDCRIYDVYSLNHQLSQFRIGEKTDDAVSSNDQCDLTEVSNCIAFGGTIGFYNGATSGGRYVHCLANGYTDFGALLEDSTLTTFRDCNIASGNAAANEPILLRNSTTNQANARTLVSNKILECHTEQVQPGTAMIKSNMTGTTKSLDLQVNGCDHYPITSNFVDLVGLHEDAYIENNYVNSDSGSGAVGITIGPNCLRTFVGKQRWAFGVNIVDNSPIDGTIYESASNINQIYYKENIAASVTDANMDLVGVASIPGLPMLEKGNVRGISVRASAAISAGSITIQLAKNGSNIGFAATLDSSNQSAEILIPRKGRIFSAGDVYNMRYTTDAGFLPSGSIDIIGSAIFELEGDDA